MERCKAITHGGDRCMHPGVKAFGGFCLTHFRMEQSGKKIQEYCEDENVNEEDD